MAASHLITREECVYTSSYCEENVWHQCDYIRKHHPSHLDEYYAVFISNANKTIPIWLQKAREANPLQPVIWDYHVLLVQKGSYVQQIYDLDTLLDFPSEFDVYMARAFGSEKNIAPQFHRQFRVVAAQTYLSKFASDRSHMLTADNTWMAPPPSYPCIATSESTNNLNSFISMDPSTGWGRVLNLREFIEMFSSAQLYAQLRSLIA